MAARAIDDALL